MERPTDDPRVQRRVEVLSHLRDGAIDLEIAATVLGVSTRQVRRLLATWLEHGSAGLVHVNHGREPANRTDAELRTRIEKLAREGCAGTNRAHLAELLLRVRGQSPTGRGGYCGRQSRSRAWPVERGLAPAERTGALRTAEED